MKVGVAMAKKNLTVVSLAHCSNLLLFLLLHLLFMLHTHTHTHTNLCIYRKYVQILIGTEHCEFQRASDTKKKNDSHKKPKQTRGVLEKSTSENQNQMERAKLRKVLT